MHKENLFIIFNPSCVTFQKEPKKILRHWIKLRNPEADVTAGQGGLLPKSCEHCESGQVHLALVMEI